MQTVRSSYSVLSHPSADLSGGGHHGSAEPAQPVPMLESTELLRGNKAVSIAHNGSLYRLQATKLGKLILTK